MKSRGLTEEHVEHILERCLVPAGDGLYSIKYDQRFKFMTPTLGIFATESIAKGSYNAFPFALDDAAWQHGNYRHEVVEGGHDIHLQKPEEVASHITEFFKNNPE